MMDGDKRNDEISSHWRKCFLLLWFKTYALELVTEMLLSNKLGQYQTFHYIMQSKGGIHIHVHLLALILGYCELVTPMIPPAYKK